MTATIKSAIKPLFIAMMVMGATSAHADITVYAAASMTNAVEDINKLYEKKYNSKVKTSFAASSTLAKQIEQGAPADIYISANTSWMDYLAKKDKIVSSSYKNLLGNRLVMITPKNNPIKTNIKMDKSFDIGNTFTGKLCTGNTASVPVGKYAKEALTNLGWWDAIKPRLVETEDVRAALNFVNRGECQLGIVYATDAKVVKNVQVINTFPITTHTPIVYPISMVKQSREAQQYYDFLQTNEAKAVYYKYGFSVL